MTERNDANPLPEVVDRATWQAEADRLLVREKAHTREGDAIAAARRRLPMVEVDASIPVIGPDGEVSLIETFEGRKQLIVYYHMWHHGRPAADQCEGCTFFTGHALELSYLHSRDVTYATFCAGSYPETSKYRDFMGWTMPWYSARDSEQALLGDLGFGGYACYVRDGDRVFQTSWTGDRGTEAGANSYSLLDLTVYGRQEAWEDSPAGWPQPYQTAGEQFRLNGRPTAQWSRIEAGHSDDLS
ncbi:DUF899 family protein [Microlunatus speluncae]|uniref:DUF899 family protein n=1 Tax=Microlunatus speluncae TaxID=2594267 RepID=UPI00126675B8|nr:DUF899 family protein [Microlunatus speluncae]